MIKTFFRQAAPIAPIGAACLGILAISPSAPASPDGAEWETAALEEGCRSCHLGAPIAEASEALSLGGLPAKLAPNTSYELSIMLEDASLENAGFLLTILTDGPAGELSASDQRSETQGAQARSTWDGTFPAEPGKARWNLTWTTPDHVEGPVAIELWANAGNYDASPLGDSLHHRVFDIAFAP